MNNDQRRRALIAAARTRAIHRQVIYLLIAGDLTQKQIGERFGLCETSISKIKYGTLGGAHTADIRPDWQAPVPLTRDAIRAIYVAAWDGIPQADISQQYGVGQWIISVIKHRKRHRQHTDDLERERRGKR